ncbi:MAG: hypothetical protein IKD76_03255 [Clostridia bacterium]|nr:hypothetical protein [Clostridia bacterium]
MIIIILFFISKAIEKFLIPAITSNSSAILAPLVESVGTLFIMIIGMLMLVASVFTIDWNRIFSTSINGLFSVIEVICSAILSIIAGIFRVIFWIIRQLFRLSSYIFTKVFKLIRKPQTKFWPNVGNAIAAGIIASITMLLVLAIII